MKLHMDQSGTLKETEQELKLIQRRGTQTWVLLKVSNRQKVNNIHPLPHPFDLERRPTILGQTCQIVISSNESNIVKEVEEGSVGVADRHQTNSRSHTANANIQSAAAAAEQQQSTIKGSRSTGKRKRLYYREPRTSFQKCSFVPSFQDCTNAFLCQTVINKTPQPRCHRR